MATTTQQAGRHVPLERIRVPENVRALEEAHVEALAGSIKLQGMLVPLVVREGTDGFELVAGFHRFAAARSLGLARCRLSCATSTPRTPPNKGLALVSTWKEEPPHPFVEKFGRAQGRIRGEDVEGAIDLSLMFEHGLRFDDSKDHAGLQLVDAVVHIVRRAVLRPDDDRVQQAYDALRPRLRGEQGRCLTIHRLRGGEEDRSSLERYRPLYGARRPH